MMALPLAAFADDHPVATPVTDLTIEAACAAASPGDTVTIPDDTYSGLNQIDIDDSGTSGNLITIRGETPGGVTFTGDHSGYALFQITGDYIKLSGLEFYDIEKNGTTNTRPIMLDGSDNSVIDNCRFDTITAASGYNGWVIWVAKNTACDAVEISHCSFTNIGDASNWCKGIVADYLATNTHIHHCYFNGFGGTSGGSPIHIGNDGHPSTDTYAIVEYCHFDDIVSDPEIISNKSSSNTYRYNYFDGGDGGMVMRLGDDCITDSNYFISNGKSAYASSIRVHGTGHKIINNYIEDAMGDAAIDIRGADSTHPKVTDVEVLNNTIVFPATYGIWAGYVYSPITDSYPENSTFKNNLIWSDQSYCFACDGFDPSGSETWTDNVAYTDGSAALWNNRGGCSQPGAGISDVDPEMTDRGDMYEPDTGSSNIYQQGTADVSVTKGIKGGTRSDPPDIGSLEIGAGGTIAMFAMSGNSVGYDWSPPVISGAGPSGTISCTADPRNVTESWTTDEVCACRVCVTDQAYDSMPAGSVDNTDSTSHSDTISRACGETYTRYVRCEDPYGNQSVSSTTISYILDIDTATSIEAPTNLRFVRADDINDHTTP